MTTTQRDRVLVFMLIAAALVLVIPPLARAGSNYRYPRTDFGQRIEGVSGDVQVWWCEATWKVAWERPAPQTAVPAATLSRRAKRF